MNLWPFNCLYPLRDPDRPQIAAAGGGCRLHQQRRRRGYGSVRPNRVPQSREIGVRSSESGCYNTRIGFVDSDEFLDRGPQLARALAVGGVVRKGAFPGLQVLGFGLLGTVGIVQPLMSFDEFPAVINGNALGTPGDEHLLADVALFHRVVPCPITEQVKESLPPFLSSSAEFGTSPTGYIG